MTMFVDRLKKIVQGQSGKSGMWVRTLLKEPVQDSILHFVYNHATYKHSIFTGGTALRKLYGLPRLSEDVDFDLRKPMSLPTFARDLTAYMRETLLYQDVTTKISGNGQTVFLKFPTLLSEIGFSTSRSDSGQLIVRSDFAVDTIGHFQTEVRSVITQDMAFFIEGYDLPTLFANKIIAFLKRSFFRGKTQTVSFKGRDLFDLVWLFERSIRSNFQFEPRWERVYQGMGSNDRQKILRQILEKVGKIKERDVTTDLLPFLEPGTIKAFSGNFLPSIHAQLNHFLKR